MTSPTPEEVRALIERANKSTRALVLEAPPAVARDATNTLDDLVRALEALEAERARCPWNAGRHNSDYLRCVYHQGHAGPHWANGSKWLDRASDRARRVDEDAEALRAQRDALAEGLSWALDVLDLCVKRLMALGEPEPPLYRAGAAHARRTLAEYGPEKP